MNIVQRSINTFLEFHTGTVNIILHIIGFLGVGYALKTQNVLLFMISVLVLEFGHVYNHIVGIKEYDLSPHVVVARVTGFIVLCVAVYFLFQAI